MKECWRNKENKNGESGEIDGIIVEFLNKGRRFDLMGAITRLNGRGLQGRMIGAYHMRWTPEFEEMLVIGPHS